MTTITPALERTDLAPSWTASRSTIATAALVVTLGVVWLVSLSRSLFDPMSFDHALYAFLTERAMAGDRLYTDVWDQNAPGIVGIHWLATSLVGRSPMALRVFDAGWQLLTLMALVALGARDGRRWQVGLLAATLFALAYYGMGYVHTAQRDGFAVLPLLLAVHAIVPVRPRATRRAVVFARHLFGGVMGFAVFAIKPPLGLCFGVLWLLALAVAVEWKRGQDRFVRSTLRAVPAKGSCPLFLTGVVGLSAGFILSAAASVGLLIRLGWWEGLWPVLTRQDVPGYIQGPRLVGSLLPPVLVGLIGIAAVAWIAQAWRNGAENGVENGTGPFYAKHPSGRPGKTVLSPFPRAERARIVVVGLVLFTVLLTVQQWLAWRHAFLELAGLLVPALGSVLVGRWRERSWMWRTSALLAAAALAAVVWQGWFYLYHFPPLLAFAGYLVATELLEGRPRLGRNARSGRLWFAACLAGVAHLAVSHWGSTMTLSTRSPWVLSGTTLGEHYTRITRHKTRFPTYATTARVAERVRVLTAETDPIACLMDEPRIYYFSQRPSACSLLRTQECYRDKFPGLLRDIEEKRPKVVLARIPSDRRHAEDRDAVASAVFEDIEQYFGPPAQFIRHTYRLTEIINNDVCILQPVE